MKLEYTASGIAYTRITFSKAFETESTRKIIQDLLSKIGNDNHYFSILYNAYTEERLGEIVKQYYRDSIYSVHSDSGGLQVITRGAVVSDDIKKKVYKCQGRYSDIAMSFDEIPLKVDGTSAIGDTSSRYFDKENIQHYASLSGKNYLEQLRYFLDNDYSTKPMAIIHGNCYDTFMEFYDCFMNEIPEEYIKHMGGISLSGASHGTGVIEDVERAYIMTQIPFKKFHLLGVGSIKRMLPFIAFDLNKKFDGVHLSYDSTSHTRIQSNGSYWHKTNIVKLGRDLSPKYQTLYDLICQTTTKLDCSIKQFHKIMNLAPSEYIETESDLDLYYQVVLSVFVMSVNNFINEMDVLNTKKKLLTMADRYGIVREINYCLNLNNKSDLDAFIKEHKSSQKKIQLVDDGPKVSFDMFF